MDEKRLKYFEELLLKEKESGKHLVNELEGEFKGNLREASGELAAYDSHIGDVGTDNFQIALTNRFIENEDDNIDQIDEALKRIKDKTYGKCRICGKDIWEERLKLIPFTQLCIDCEKDDLPLKYKMGTRPVEEDIIRSTLRM